MRGRYTEGTWSKGELLNCGGDHSGERGAVVMEEIWEREWKSV